MSKRYVLVEVSDPEPDGDIDAEWVRDTLTGDGYMADEHGVTFRTAEVTRWHWETEGNDVILYDGPRACGRAELR